MNVKEISDNQLIAALIFLPESVDSAQDAVRQRMRQPDFRARYAGAKANVLRMTAQDLNKHLQAVIQDISEIAADTTVKPETRLRAAQIMAEMTQVYNDRLSDAEAELYELSDPLQTIFNR